MERKTQKREKSVIEKKPRKTQKRNPVLEDAVVFGKAREARVVEASKSMTDESINSKKLNVLYPNIDDPDFQYKIAQKREFSDTRYDGRILDIEKESNHRCTAPFELMPHQLFVKNFMSMQTPYNSLLLYNGLGSGKSLTAIGVSEEMRSYMKQVGVNKRILVLASPNVVNNFRLQLFDESKLRMENGIWTINSSIAQSILDEINPTHFKDMSKSRILANVQALIKTYYDFKGYVKFSNEVSNALKPFPEGDPRRIRKIQAMFNNHLFVIDEVHNIRLTRDNDDLTTANYLYMIAKYAKNVRFVLLSATPMYNSYKEIIWLTNLMNVNDRRTEITVDQIFTKTGEFRIPVSPAELVGEELLRKKLMGYVSYVRGENPYTFPFRIYKTNIQDQEKNTNSPIYPPLFMTKLGSIQERVYDIALKNIQSQRKVDTSTDASTTLVSLALPKTTASSPVSEPSTESAKTTGGEESETQNEKEVLKRDDEPKTQRVEGSEPSRRDEPLVPLLMDYLETLDNIGYEQLRVPIQTLNIVYQDISQEQKDSQPNLDYFVGKLGLEQIVQFTTDKRCKYQPSKTHFFAKEKLRPYSQKITTILDLIQNSVGIVMIYSEFIYGGVIPMALALEEMGFTRASRTQGKPSTSLFIEPPTKPVGGMYYTLITGDKDFSPNNSEDLAKINHSDNHSGEYVKVVIISRAGAEGLDFKNIRQIHIMEPWYNMSRIEQIIGRGVRNMSHCNLPMKERNVEIYMHASKTVEGKIAADMYLYQLSFKKAIQIGRVGRILKEISVDCLLNREQANFTVENMNQVLKIHTSTSQGDIDYKVGDRPYTAICDYSDSCAIKCQSNISEEILTKNLGINQFTYSTAFLKANQGRIMEIIRILFTKQTYYPIDVLVETIHNERKYPIEQIYYTLTYLIQNKNEYLVDKLGRLGHLINRGDIYAFQPIEITDESISVFDRTFPVEYKIPKIHIILSPTFSSEDDINPQPKSMEKTEDVIEEIIPNTYETIMEQIQSNIDIIESVSGQARSKSNKQSWNDYMHAGDLFSTLRDVFSMDLITIQQYMIHHALDSMSMSTKLILYNHFLMEKSPDTIKPEIYSEVYKYLQKCIHRNGQGDEILRTVTEGHLIQLTSKGASHPEKFGQRAFTPSTTKSIDDRRSSEYFGREYLVLANEKNQVEVFKKSGERNIWVAGQYTDIQYVQRNIIEPLRMSMTPLKEHVGNILGIYLYEVSKERTTQSPIFKIKDFTKKTSSRNAKGENMKKAGKIREVELLKLALQNMYPENESIIKESFSESKYNQGNLNILLELVLRYGFSSEEDPKADVRKKTSMLSPETYAMLSTLF